jgi:dipeptidyl aminopeptidase/acylaminoacyl peptidase
VSVGAIAATAILSANAQTPKPVTIDDLMGLRTIVDVEIAPAGTRVAYVVSTPSLVKNEHEPALFLMSTGGGPATRVAADARIFTPALPAPRLRWSPDGSMLSFLGTVAERPQVFASSGSGGPSRAVTAALEGVFAFEWAPDGKSLAYITREPMSAEEQRQRADRSFVTRVGAPERPTRLWVQPLHAPADGGLRAGEARVLTPATHYVDSFSWSPDGQQIVYSAAPTTGFTAPYYTRLYAVSLAGGDARPIVDRNGMNTSPQVSPDGKLIAFVTTSERMGIMAPRGLAVVPASGGDRARIRSHSLGGAWIGEMTWARDSRSIYALMNEGTFATGAHMFEQPIVRVWIEDGRAERVISGPTVDYSLSLSGDGKTLAYRAVEPRTMGDLFVLDTGTGRTTRLTHVNPELEGMALGELKPTKWRSFDGMEIWGLLLTPPGWSPGRKLPLLVYCHGGPIGGVTYGIFPQFMHIPGQVDPYPTEAMASAGYAVLFPMPRGGSGYGEAGHRAIIDAWGEPDYRDIMAGVDHLIAEGVADPDRLGVMGASYGGFMANWIVTQTNRFKAASAGASISDLTDLYYLPDGGDLLIEYFKRPWEARDSYATHSPLTFVQNVTTPLLLQHGERDPRVPIAGAQRFHRALKALGKTVEFDIYPRGGHVLYEPVLEREQMRRNLEWFTRWIDAAPSAGLLYR